MLWVIQKCKYERQQEVWRREREGNFRAKNYYCRETNKITMVCGWFIRNKQCHHCWQSYLHGQDSKLLSSNHLPYTLITHHHIHSSSWATLHQPHFVSPQIWSDLANTHKADITRSFVIILNIKLLYLAVLFKVALLNSNNYYYKSE